MPEIREHQNEQFYDGDDKLFDVSVDFDADARRGNGDATLVAVERLRQAVSREAQQIQDELDTDGDIHENS